MDVSSFVSSAPVLPPAGAQILYYGDIMTKSESRQLLADLIEYAEAGKKLRFEFICNWPTYCKHRISRRTFLTIIDSLNYAADSMLKRYCKGLQDGTADFTDLLVRKSLLKAVEFYNCEMLMITDRIYEYEAYLMDGHLLTALLGEERARCDLFDHREDF